MNYKQLTETFRLIAEDIDNCYYFNTDTNLFELEEATEDGKQTDNYEIILYIITSTNSYKLTLNTICKGYKDVETAFKRERFLLDIKNEILIVDHSFNITDFIAVDKIESVSIVYSHTTATRYFEK